MSDKTGYGVAGILALGLIIATFIGGRSLENMRAADDGITVKGAVSYTPLRAHETREARGWGGGG